MCLEQEAAICDHCSNEIMMKKVYKREQEDHPGRERESVLQPSKLEVLTFTFGKTEEEPRSVPADSARFLELEEQIAIQRETEK